jgi:hypothetical protein
VEPSQGWRSEEQNHIEQEGEDRQNAPTMAKKDKESTVQTQWREMLTTNIPAVRQPQTEYVACVELEMCQGQKAELRWRRGGHGKCNGAMKGVKRKVICRSGGTGTVPRWRLSAPMSRSQTGLTETRRVRQTGRQGASSAAA